MNTRTIIMSFYLLVFVSSALADPQLDQARGEAQLAKMGSIAEELSLDKNQEKVFWPLYDNYQRDLQKLGDKRIALIKDIQAKQSSLTDAQASELIRRAFALEEERLGLKRRNAAVLLDKLPPRIVARYLQLENKIQTHVDAQISERMPLVKQ